MLYYQRETQCDSRCSFAHMCNDKYILRDNEGDYCCSAEEENESVWSAESVPFDIGDAEDEDFTAEAEEILINNDDAAVL